MIPASAGGVGARPLIVTPFVYLPALRLAFLALVLGVVLAVRYRAWRAVDLRRGAWLAVPLTVGTGLCAGGPLVGRWAGGLGPLSILLWVVGTQVAAAAAVPLAAGCFRRQARLLGAVAVYVAFAFMTFGLGMVAGDLGGLRQLVSREAGTLLLVLLVWFVPSILGLLSVRRRWGCLRLGGGLALSWLLAVALALVAVYLVSGRGALPGFADAAIVGVVFGGPCLGVYWLLLCLHSWSREAVGRTFGVAGMRSPQTAADARAAAPLVGADPGAPAADRQ